MKKYFLFAAAMVCGAFSAIAQERELENKNHFYIGGLLHFNVTATMRNVPQGAMTGPDYDDGSVREDSSANAGGRTWNWSYSKTNQVIGAYPDQMIEMHGAQSIRDGTTDKLTTDLTYGFEAGYGREFWRWGDEKRPYRAGIEVSFSASELGLTMNNQMQGYVTRTADRYGLPTGVVVPTAPYSGSFEGPLPPAPPAPLLITNLVSRTTSTETETSTQGAKLDGTYWGFRLGPFIEAPLPGRFSLQGGLGLSLVHVASRLSYTEDFTITGIGGAPVRRTDSEKGDDWIAGFYASARLNYWINDNVALYGGVEFQSLDKLTVTAANREASIDFGTTFGVTLGVLYSF